MVKRLLFISVACVGLFGLALVVAAQGPGMRGGSAAAARAKAVAVQSPVRQAAPNISLPLRGRAWSLSSSLQARAKSRIIPRGQLPATSMAARIATKLCRDGALSPSHRSLFMSGTWTQES